jgi:glutamate synthase (NADPH/NADH) large chain
VRRHVEATGSAVGEALLESWAEDADAVAARLSKIMPRDYRSVLEVRAAALEEGLDADGPETLDRIMEASRG